VQHAFRREEAAVVRVDETGRFMEIRDVSK
jgi:hypothetical protein